MLWRMGRQDAQDTGQLRPFVYVWVLEHIWLAMGGSNSNRGPSLVLSPSLSPTYSLFESKGVLLNLWILNPWW